MSKLFLNVLPAIHEQGTLIIQADKEIFRSPAKAVTDMNGRRIAQGEFRLTVRTDVLFLKKIKN